MVCVCYRLWPSTGLRRLANNARAGRAASEARRIAWCEHVRPTCISSLKSHGGRHRDKGNRIIYNILWHRNVLYACIYIYMGYFAQRSIGRGSGRLRRRRCVRIPSLCVCGCDCLWVNGRVCGVCGTLLRIRDFDGTTAGRPACDVCQGNGRTPRHVPWRSPITPPPTRSPAKNRWNLTYAYYIRLCGWYTRGRSAAAPVTTTPRW